MNRLHFLGHAGFLLQSNGFSLLMDPWVSNNPAFLNTWYRFPDNSFIAQKNKSIFQEVTHIWCSHEHTDHFDPEFLKILNKDINVILGAFPSDRLKNSFKNLGFNNFIKLSHLQTINVFEDVQITMLLEQPSLTEHSSIYIKTPNLKFFHNADSMFANETINDFKNKIDENIDIFFGQYIDPSSYPSVLNLNNNYEKIKKIENLQNTSIRKNFTDFSNKLNAKYSIPGAGPAIVLSDNSDNTIIDELMSPGEIIDQEWHFKELKKDLKSCILKPMNIGSEINLDKIEFPPYIFPNNQEKRNIIEKSLANYTSYAASTNIQMPLIELSTRTNEIYELAKKYCPKTLKLINNIFSVYLTDLDISLVTNLNKRNTQTIVFQGNYYCAEKNNLIYQISLNSKLWIEYILNQIHYDDINFSRLYQVDQSKRSFNIYLIRILKSYPEISLLKEVERNTSQISSSRTIIKKYNDKDYKILQKCPHLGVCFDDEEPDEKGIITCPAHSYKFDIISGKCIKGDRNLSIIPH